MPLIPGSVHKSKIVTFLPGSSASGGPATYDDLYILDLATNTLPGLMTAEEKKKLEKYTGMLGQVEERLKQLQAAGR